jgi:hypothetical protein
MLLSAIRRRRPEFTGRTMMITAMALFLVVVLASPLQTYLNRRDSLAASQKQQSQLKQRVALLQHQSAQWSDPSYVRSTADSSPAAVKRAGHEGTWNAALWSSVQNSDSTP